MKNKVKTPLTITKEVDIETWIQSIAITLNSDGTINEEAAEYINKSLYEAGYDCVVNRTENIVANGYITIIGYGIIRF